METKIITVNVPVRETRATQKPIRRRSRARKKSLNKCIFAFIMEALVFTMLIAAILFCWIVAPTLMPINPDPVVIGAELEACHVGASESMILY